MSSAMVVKVKKGWGKAMWMCLLITLLAAFGVLQLGQGQAADAPATVGALRDGGGKPLTKNEILKLFAERRSTEPRWARLIRRSS